VIPPRLLVLTDRRVAGAAGRDLATSVAAAVDAGAPAVLFREKDLAADERARLGADVAAVVRDAGAAFGVASDRDLAARLGADWVHLAADDPAPSAGRDHGRSCHDAAELASAAQEGAAYATVSPVASTPTKPGYGPPLGIRRAAELAAEVELPVLGLGGVAPGIAAALRSSGLYGVAVLGAVIGADDPGRAVEKLLAEVGAEVAS
jgi:thiamine-phosphate pyrophosphorylase